MIKLKEILKNENMTTQQAAEVMGVSELKVYKLMNDLFPEKEDIQLVSSSFGIHPDQFMSRYYYVGAVREGFEIIGYKRRISHGVQFYVKCAHCGEVFDRNIRTLERGTKCKDCGVYFY